MSGAHLKQRRLTDCPHRLAVFQPAKPEKPYNGRLARAALPCLLRPGHDGEHRTHGDRSWT